VAHARGFACAFAGEYLLIALSGMTWKCPAWRILRPLDAWLDRYAAWLAGLVDLPVEIAHTLNLAPLSASSAAMVVSTIRGSVPVGGSGGQVFSGDLSRLVGEGGMALTYIMSGSMFGGVALLGAHYGLTQGYSSQLFWYFWGLICAGLVYGVYALGRGLREVAWLVWRWNSPLRTLKRR